MYSVNLCQWHNWDSTRPSGERAHWLVESNRHSEWVTSRSESTDACVCECTTEGTVCVVRGGWELNCDRKKRWKKWRKERRTKPKCRDCRNRADNFSRNLLRVKKKKTLLILWSFQARGSVRWEQAWWILASLAPAARESRATRAADIRACALASVRARSGRSMRAHWRGSRPPFARVCLCSRDPPSRQPRRRRPATVWVSAAAAISTSPRCSRRNSADAERWGDCESSNFSNLLSGGAGGLPLRGARGRKRCSQTTSIYPLADFYWSGLNYNTEDVWEFVL